MIFAVSRRCVLSAIGEIICQTRRYAFGARRAGRSAQAPAGDIMDHIAAFFDARIAALTGAGIKRNRLVLDPGMGFFWGLLPNTSLSVLARFDELRLRFDLPVLLSVSRKSFLRALTGRGPGMSGPRHSLQSLPPPQVG